MTDTTFTQYTTAIDATWAQDVNNTIYRALGSGGVAPITGAQVIANLGLLTTSAAASTYLTQANATATYLTQANATATYLTQANATATYAAKGANADITSLSGLASINSGQLGGIQSRVINGSCEVNTRGNGIALTANYQYGGADRHMVSIIGGSAITGSIIQTTNIATSTGFAQSAQGSWTTGNFSLQHRFRATNVDDLNSRTIVASAKVYQNTGGARNFKIQLYRPTTTVDTFSAQTFLQQSATISVPSGLVTAISATFTLGATDASLGLALQIIDADAPNTVVSKIYAVGDIDLRPGTVVPTYFETRPVELEKLLCNAYAYPLSDVSGTGGWIGNGVSYATNIVDTYVKHPTPMRAAPSFVPGNLTTWNAGAAGASQVAAFNYATSAYITITGALTVSGAVPSKGGFMLKFTAATSFSVSGGALIGTSIDPSTTAYLDAEL